VIGSGDGATAGGLTPMAAASSTEREINTLGEQRMARGAKLPSVVWAWDIS
jgi:hypothetical protein